LQWSFAAYSFESPILINSHRRSQSGWSSIYLHPGNGITYYHILYQRYSTSYGERESWPFHDEPETSIFI